MPVSFYKTNADVSTSKKYEKVIKSDRSKLLLNHFRLHDEGVPIVILVSGNHASGYPQVVNLLNEWMDTRFIETHVYQPNSDEEAERPYFWKYWRTYPEAGKISLHVGGWYTEPYINRLDGNLSADKLEQMITSINRFEELLSADGVLLIKIWLELDEETQKANLQEKSNRPYFAWQVTMDDWQNSHNFKERLALANEFMEQTNKKHSPWFKIDAKNAYKRDISALHLITELFDNRLNGSKPKEYEFKKKIKKPAKTNHLAQLDLTASLKRKKYLKKMYTYKEMLYIRAWEMYLRKKSIVLVFEGADAAGKGGAIRRLIRCLDARLYRVIQISAPTKHEISRHYLWRFWMQIPRAGFMTIYDRSWYGRVLVERVEGFASEGEWRRAYEEINQFEKELTDTGIIVLKFWLEISEEEQLKRFGKREKTEYKQYKLTDEDWRNREKRFAYNDAANDMIEYTNTSYAPWHVIPAEDKKYARIEVLNSLNNALKKVLGA